MAQLILPRRQVDQQFFQIVDGIKCDHRSMAIDVAAACKTTPSVAPRLLVPSKTQEAPGHRHLHVDFKLHYCLAHEGELKFDELVTEKVRATVEAHAKKTRPIDFKPDFEAAHIVYVSIFSPGYKYYAVVRQLLPREAAEQHWGGPIV